MPINPALVAMRRIVKARMPTQMPAVWMHREHAQPDGGQERGHEEHRDDDRECRSRHRSPRVLGFLGKVGDGLDACVGDHRDGDAREEVAPGRRDAPVDVAEDGPEVEQEDQAEDHEHHLGDQVGQRKHQVERARLLDPDDVDDDEEGDQGHRRAHVPCVMGLEQLEQGHVLAENAQVADGEVRGDGDRGHVVEELDPADDESDRVVEGSSRKARAAARVGDGGCALGIVERCRDEDRAGEDQGQRGQPERKRRGDAEGVVDARADVAVGGREQGRSAQRAGQLGRAADDHPQVAWAPAPASDGVRAHRSRE